MKQAVIAICLALCLLLTGCAMGFEGDYLWQQSHPMPDSTESGQNISVSDYASLYDALRQAVEAGLPQVTILGCPLRSGRCGLGYGPCHYSATTIQSHRRLCAAGHSVEAGQHRW